MKTKLCTNCKRELLVLKFGKCKDAIDKLQRWCKVCKNKHFKGYYQKNKEKINEKHKIYWESHKKELLEQQKIYRDTHKEEAKQYRQTHKPEARKYQKNRYKTDINFKLIHYLRARLYKVLKNNIKSKSVSKLLGCSIEQLKQHLEKQFTKGMTWKNYGKWHVDHIKPCCQFDLTKPSEQKNCFNYKNLQPLWAGENLSKKRKLKCI